MSKFKKITVFMLAVFAAFSVSAQNKTFEKISKLPEVQYVYISESMLSSMGGMVDQPRFVAAAVDKLKSLEILTCEDPAAFDRVRKMLDPCIDELQLLSKVHDDQEDIEIYGTRNGDNLSSLLLVKSEKDDFCAIFITGNIDPDSLRSMSKSSTQHITD